MKKNKIDIKDITIDVVKNLMDNPVEAEELLSANLFLFIKVFHFLTTNEQFQIKKIHKRIIKALMRIVLKEQKNLLIEMPPRAGKSEIIDYFLCWTYTINPNCNNIITCYSDKLVGKFSKKMKEIVNTELYQKIFKLKISEDTKSAGLWKIKDGGETRATSIEGSITGFGAGAIDKEFGGVLVIDDPMKAVDAKSEVMRQNVIDLFENTLKSRRNNLEETPIIVIMQRLHKQDLAGYLENEIKAGRLDKKKWLIIKAKALQDDGTSFWEEKYPAKALEEMRRSQPYTFNSQYQQEPINEDTSYFKTEMFEEKEINIEDCDYSYVIADTAYKDKQKNDYTVFSCFGVLDKKLYLTDIFRDKIKAVDIESRVIPFIKKNTRYGFEGCYIEPKGHGIYLNQKLPDENFVMPRDTEIDEFFKDRKLDKVERANAIMPFFTNNKLYINKNIQQSLKNEIVSECINFPEGLHDDIVDTIIDGCKKYMLKEMIGDNDAWN